MPTKRCAHSTCNSDSRYGHREHMKDVTFFKFIQPSKDLEKCKRWVQACRRENFSIKNISQYTYICSKHFVGGAPSEEHPDPLPTVNLPKRRREIKKFEIQNKKRKLSLKEEAENDSQNVNLTEHVLIYITPSLSEQLDVTNTNWVTVFGYPTAFASLVLKQLADCGNIIAIRLPAKGNWMCIKYSSEVEAMRALAKNGKIFSEMNMIGVIPCSYDEIFFSTEKIDVKGNENSANLESVISRLESKFIDSSTETAVLDELKKDAMVETEKNCRSVASQTVSEKWAKETIKRICEKNDRLLNLVVSV